MHKESHYFFFLKEYVDKQFTNGNYVNTDIASENFQEKLERDFSDDEFCDLLIYSGLIPDNYEEDSSQETLYSKLIEILVCEWANRLELNSNYVKQKSSYEDVTIEISNRIIVCDAKSFRLGRSQKAPNLKDFVKLADIRKWMNRHDNAVGGLVTFPITHEWKRGSDAYQYCSDSTVPTVMLPYHYLSYLLKYKKEYDTCDLLKLWDYDSIFPKILTKNMKGGNKAPYWNAINSSIIKITNTDKNTFNDFIKEAKELILQCVNANKKVLEKQKESQIQKIREDVSSISDIEEVKDNLIKARTIIETSRITSTIKNIDRFRITK